MPQASLMSDKKSGMKSEGKISTQGQDLVSGGFFRATDLDKRIEEIVSDVALETGFKPERLLGKSSWWGSKKIGAFHHLGEFEGKRCVLKVQGVKLATSEIYMIEEFARQNKSKIIRPPFLYATLPWDEKRGYEALIMEDVGNERVVHIPTNEGEVDLYYQYFAEYRKNCRVSPWLAKPEGSIGEFIKSNFEKWRRASYEIYPNHPLRNPEDDKLIDEAVLLLEKGYKGVDWDFQHAHLSDSDLYRVGNQIVILSNLFWSWRAPFYDAIFAYHWFMYHLSDTDLSPKDVEEQRNIWLKYINDSPEVSKGDNQRLLKLAFLERAAAGLNLDALSVGTEKPLARYLVESTRLQLIKLIEELS